MKLSTREKRLLTVLVILLVSAVSYYVILRPFYKAVSGYREKRVVHINESKELARLYQKLVTLRNKRSMLESRLKLNADLGSYVEKSIEKNNLKSKLSSTQERPLMKRDSISIKTIKVRLESAGMKEILALVKDIESARGLCAVSQFSLRQAEKGSETYDATITFEQYVR
jgi:type II secretory pathway component PulM